MLDFDVKLPLHLRAEHGATVCALEELAFVGMFDGEVNLDVDLGIKDFLAQSTPGNRNNAASN